MGYEHDSISRACNVIFINFNLLCFLAYCNVLNLKMRFVFNFDIPYRCKDSEGNEIQYMLKQTNSTISDVMQDNNS